MEIVRHFFSLAYSAVKASGYIASPRSLEEREGESYLIFISCFEVVHVQYNNN